MEKVYRLKETHPTLKKVRELEEYAEKLGIILTVGNDNQLFISDEEFPSVEFQYRDFEQNPSGYETTTSFPYFAETKILRVENNNGYRKYIK